MFRCLVGRWVYEFGDLGEIRFLRVWSIDCIELCSEERERGCRVKFKNIVIFVGRYGC